ALTASYELLTRQVRRDAASAQMDRTVPSAPRPGPVGHIGEHRPAAALTVGTQPPPTRPGRRISVKTFSSGHGSGPWPIVLPMTHFLAVNRSPATLVGTSAGATRQTCGHGG